jgi:glycosyltransferase involved in cell wall biosynthesis
MGREQPVPRTEAGPSVEFIVPFYGDPAHLRETVASLQTQVDTDWRAMVIDDCYPDPSASAWVRDLDDDRISHRRHDQNLGTTATYGEGLALATADYVTFLGCDDRLLPGYLAALRPLFGRSPSVIQPGVRVIDGQGEVSRSLTDRVKAGLRPTRRTGLLAGEPVLTSLLRGNWTYFPSLCWRRETVARLGFRPFPVVQDLALLTDVLVDGGSILVDSEVTFEYRRHRDSYSNAGARTGTRFEEERTFFDEVAVELDGIGWHQAARAARLRPTSRAHALTHVPRALLGADLAAVGRLSGHAAAWRPANRAVHSTTTKD